MRLLSWLLAVLMATGAVLLSPPSASADPRLPITLTASNQVVDAGDRLIYQVNVACSIPTGCPNTTLTFSRPPGASGDGSLSEPWPSQVTNVQTVNGRLVVTANLAAGDSVNALVSWPTANYTTTPGPQPVTVVAETPSGTGPSEATATIDLRAVPNLAFIKTGPSQAAADIPVTYTIAATNYPIDPDRPRGTLALDDVVVKDVLPAGAEFISATGGGTYDPATRTVTWNVPTLQGSTTFYQYVTVRYPSSAVSVGDTLTDTASVSGTGHGTTTTYEKDATFTTTIAESEPGVVGDFAKSGSPAGFEGQDYGFELDAWNTSNVAASATLDDQIPDGLRPKAVRILYSGAAAFIDIPVTVTYSDGSTATFNVRNDNVDTPIPVGPAGTRVTRIQATLPDIQPSQLALLAFTSDVVLSDLPGGGPAEIENCMTGTLSAGTGQDFTKTACATTFLDRSKPDPLLTKVNDQVPVAPGGTVTWDLNIRNNGTGSKLFPYLFDLIPPDVDYVPGSLKLEDPATADRCPTVDAADVTVTDNYLFGRTAVIWKAPATSQPIEYAGAQECAYSISGKVKAGTSPGVKGGNAADPNAYRGNLTWLFDAEQTIAVPRYDRVADQYDVNKNGNSTEQVYFAADDYSVADAADMFVQKQVRGDDGVWQGSAEVPGQEDQVAPVTSGGTFDYRVQLGNMGNRQLTDFVAYDLLGTPTSPGVTDGRYNDRSNTVWTPVLTGPIDTGGTPVTITYSTKEDPCRPEMDATRGTAPFYCGGQVDPTFVPASAVTDWTLIRSLRFDFGDAILQPGQIITFEWPMTVPVTRFDHSALQNGDMNWNKVAAQAEVVETGGNRELLPAEPPWVAARVVKLSEPAHAISKTASPQNASVGDTVKYTVTVRNTGDVPYTEMTVDDDLSEVLQHASYNGDATASSGAVTVTGNTLHWVGPLPVGGTVTITYSVTITSALPDNPKVANHVSSVDPGGNCPPGSTDPACTVELTPGEEPPDSPAHSISKTASTQNASVGDTVKYTVTVRNTGDVPYPQMTLDDDLSEILQHASYNNDATASSGTVTVNGDTLHWTGPLPVGGTVTITYSVTVTSALPTDPKAANHVSSPDPGGNCPPGSTDPACTVELTPGEEPPDNPAHSISKTASTQNASVGDTVKYMVTVRNTGDVPYPQMTVDDDLSEVLAHASYNNDATASSGTVTVNGDTLHWAGPLPVGGTVTITYSVTVTSALPDNPKAANHVSSPDPGGNCPPGSTDPACTVELTPGEEPPDNPTHSISKTASPQNASVGDKVTYTLTVRNTGDVPYPQMTVDDDLSEVLAHASYNNDATASSGTVTVNGGTLHWAGPLPVGGTVTITYSVTVTSALPDNPKVANHVSSPDPGGNCPPGSTDPACTVELTPGDEPPDNPTHTITKTADHKTAKVGDTVKYTVTVRNTGDVPYSEMTLDDDLSEILAHATYNDDATASSGTVTHNDDTLHWAGPLPVGGTVTITYSVTITSALPTDPKAANHVSSPDPGGNCPPGSTDRACSVELTPGEKPPKPPYGDYDGDYADTRMPALPKARAGEKARRA
ncbi:DUF7927 domain-containing protein [Streptomyces laurentii]|uniref:DUF7927 domain-containing protein n=1 Tax=Streptomyces laurentii TaxID=39478 RepID=UPI00368592AB